MALTYIIGGKIVLPQSVVEGKALAFSQETGKIEGVVDTVPAGAATIDACGNYVAPGLVDIHIHGYLGEDTCDAKPEGIKKMAYGIAQNGVTSFLPTTMTVPKPHTPVSRYKERVSGVMPPTALMGIWLSGARTALI